MEDQQRVSGPAGTVPGKFSPGMHKHRKNMMVGMWIRTVVLAVVVVVLALVVWGLVAWNTGMKSEGNAVNTSEYQAVFLTNGQVYFGKLKVVTPNYLKLTNIYYLQVQSSSTGTTSASQLAAASTSGTSGSNVQLVKLGNELQGPQDMMAINREQVLFWENLKPSGKVTQAINTYLKNQ
jgi:hypothetical protein